MYISFLMLSPCISLVPSTQTSRCLMSPPDCCTWQRRSSSLIIFVFSLCARSDLANAHSGNLSWRKVKKESCHHHGHSLHDHVHHHHAGGPPLSEFWKNLVAFGSGRARG